MMADLSKLISFLLRWTKDVRHARTIMALVIVTGLISGFANTGLLALMSSVLSARGHTDPRRLLAFIGLCLALPLTRFVSGALLLRLAARAVYEMRMKLCGGLVALPLRRFEEQGAHRALAVLTTDIGSVTDAVTSFPTLCMQLFIVVGSLIYLGWLSWQVLLGLLGFMILGLLSYRLPIRGAMSHIRDTRQLLDSLIGHFRAVIDGSKELRLNRERRRAFLLEELQPTAEKAQHSAVAANTLFIGATSWGQILFFILIGLILFGLPKVGVFDSRILMGYSLVVLYLMTPLESIMNALPILSRATAAVEAIDRMGLVLSESSPELEANSSSRRETWERLDLVGVTHSYRREGEPGNFVLGPVDLTFRPGELVFLVGGNGSGKTTLAKLITGLYVPEAGEIRFDGRTLSEKDHDSYRQHFAAVFSDFCLFEKLLGIPREDLDARAQDQLAELRLSHKVQVQAGAFSTLDLSQGQRKRLALLTACLEDRELYLFDEWAADQDPVFKEIFYRQILPSLKAKGKAVLVISHDDRYYDVADRVIKLEYGQIQLDRSISSTQVEAKGLAVAGALQFGAEMKA